MKNNNLLNVSISIILSIFLIGCGDETSKEPVKLDKNIQKIVDWSKGTGTTPTEADYIAAGVDLKGKNVNEINAYIQQLHNGNAVDTVEEIEAIVEELGVTILDSDGDGIYDTFDDTPHGGEGNHAPTGSIIREGLVTNVIVNTQVKLTTKSNDIDGDTLRYVWYLDKKPVDSTSTLSATNTKNVSFTPDKVGKYELVFQVHDGSDFAQDSITIMAESKDTCTNLNFFPDTVTLHANKCYLAPDGISISKKLTIEEGVRLIFGNNSTFTIGTDAELIAKGTTNNPIIMTSEDKTVGTWRGVNSSSKNVQLSHVTIEYAENGLKIGGNKDVKFSLNGCTIKDSKKYGLFDYSKGLMDIKNSTFIGNKTPIKTTTNRLYQFNSPTNTFKNNTYNYIEAFSSTITSDQTWKKINVPYFSWGVNVDKNATLTIEPGVKIFNGGYISVKGSLKAIGTKKDPIIFTRDPRDPNKVSKNEFWTGIKLETDSYYKDIAQHHELAFIQIDYAEKGLIADGDENAHFKFSDSNITNSKYTALKLNFAKGNIDKFERINLKNNNYGAYLSANALDFIDLESDFTGNKIDAIVIPSGMKVLSRGNHTWKKMSVPISVGAFNVPENVVLNIEAGNEIISGNYFWVSGALNILGTANEMVTFKGGSTLGDNGVSYKPSEGIFFIINENSTNSNISYLSIDSTLAASNYNYDGIRISGANVINNQIVPYDATVNIENSIFKNIAGNGILVDCGPNVTQSNNTFTNITDLDVRRKSCN